MRSPRFVALLPFLVLLGCSSGSNAGTPTGNASTTSVSGDAPGSACDQYLQCVAAATPDALPLALQAYGPNGTCWGGSATLAADCESACKQSMGEVAGGGAFAALCGPQHGAGEGTVNGPATGSSSSSDGGATFSAGSGSGTGAGSTESCNECANKLCATPLDDCTVSSACTDTFTCIGKCADPSDKSCDDACTPAGISAADQQTTNNLLVCLKDSCDGVCDPF